MTVDAPPQSAEPGHVSPGLGSRFGVSALALPGRLWRALSRHQVDAWFRPADPRVLAICRVLVFWYVWPGFVIEDYASYAAFKSSAWFPVSFFAAWSVPLFDASVLSALSVAANVLVLFALLGFAYPLSAWGAALVTLYLRGVPQNFGKVNHSENLLIFALFVFALARAADVWSLDALIRRWVSKSWLSTRPPDGAPRDAYRWPVRFILLLIVTMYGAAATSKLMNSGLAWATSDSFRLLLLRHHFTHRPPTQIGVWLANSPQLCHVLAFGALAVELSSPLALLGKWPARLILPALFGLQLGIWLLLGVKFAPLLPLFMCLLPWHYVLMVLDASKVWLARTFTRFARGAPN